MLIRNLIISMLFVIGLTTFVAADSWGPYLDERVVDPTGEYYVVIEKIDGWGDDSGRGGPVQYTIAKRKEGSDPVDQARDKEGETDENYGEIIENPKVSVRDGDKILGTGTLARAPLRVLVSSTGLGFCTIDVFGYNYGDRNKKDAIIIVGANGTIMNRKSIGDLFPATKPYKYENYTTAGGLMWHRGGWIDEIRKQVIVLTPNFLNEEFDYGYHFEGKHEPLLVNIKDGSVKPGTDADIVRTITQQCLGGLTPALDLLISKHLKIDSELLIKIYENKKLPLSARLRAAVALASMGDRRGASLVKKTALADYKDWNQDKSYAIIQTPKILTEDLLPTLSQLASKQGGSYFSSLSTAFLRAKGIPNSMLIDLALDTGTIGSQVASNQLLSRNLSREEINISIDRLQSELKVNYSYATIDLYGKMLELADNKEQPVIPTLESLAASYEQKIQSAINEYGKNSREVRVIQAMHDFLLSVIERKKKS